MNPQLLLPVAQRNAVEERAKQLVKAGCPSYAMAWYQAYDDLRRTAGQGASNSYTDSAPTAVAEPRPTTIPVSLQPQVMQLAVPVTADEMLQSAQASERLKRRAVAPKGPSRNLLAEVLAPDQLDADALSAYLSVRAAMAYGRRDEIEDQVRAEGGQHFAYFAAGRTAAFGYTLYKHAFLSFRGTISLGQFCRTDLNIIPSDRPLRHLGFNRAWLLVRERIIEWADALPEDLRRLVLTGHSLGAALAVLAAFHLVERYPIRAVITFGTPRVGLFSFRHSYHVKSCGEQTLHAITRRYTHETDLVSRIPPPLLYCHVGEEWIVHSSGVIEKGRPVGHIARFEEWWESLPLKEQSSKPPSIDSISSSSPATPNSATPLSRADRTKLATWKFLQHLRLIASIAQATSLQFLWVASAAFGVLFCAAFRQDVRRHSHAKYVNAYRKAYPELTLIRDPQKLLAERMIQSFSVNLMKKNQPSNQA
jgi:Lipase (class 3)